MTTQLCMICKEDLNYVFVRYPRIVCSKCIDSGDVKDIDGNNVSFGNTHFSGGFESLHYIDNKIVVKNEHMCIVKGVKCYADEARVGGIVIQTVL